MLNAIWAILILTAVVVGGLTGAYSGESSLTETAFGMAEAAVMKTALPLAGILMLWLGMMKLAEASGMVRSLARLLSPGMRLLFPDVPRGHPASGAMVMNFAANMLGIGNAATPLGLKAMAELEKINPRPGTASNAMCTFLAINTSSVTLIPATAIAVLATAGVSNPERIVITALGATLCSTAAAIAAVKILERLPWFRVAPAATAVSGGDETAREGPVEASSSLPPPVSRGRLMAFAATAASFGFAALLLELNPGWSETVRVWLGGAIESAAGAGEAESPARRFFNAAAAMAIPYVFFVIVGYAWVRRLPVFELFVDGAKEGFQVALRIMPYLVAMLVAMGLFRDSGALALLGKVLGPALAFVGFPVDLLPMAVMRPLSGGASVGLLAEIAARPDLADGVKHTAATMFGSTETTFYVLAVYFGSVSIRKTRHAAAAGLLADAAGIIAAVFFCRLYFGY
ncbi:MAG TPA: nucleoside recognition domain-containing protein [Verrucomicrobiales bacterium]|nr:nucleoside recognition domain-containing protein [Verrucomicrobiales bacterium]